MVSRAHYLKIVGGWQPSVSPDILLLTISNIPSKTSINSVSCHNDAPPGIGLILPQLSVHEGVWIQKNPPALFCQQGHIERFEILKTHASL